MTLSQENIDHIGRWINNEIVMPHLAPYWFGRQNMFQRKFTNKGQVLISILSENQRSAQPLCTAAHMYFQTTRNNGPGKWCFLEKHLQERERRTCCDHRVLTHICRASFSSWKRSLFSLWGGGCHVSTAEALPRYSISISCNQCVGNTDDYSHCF